jgi:hypothetical protein
MSTPMNFTSGGNVLNFEAGADYPASRPVELFQVQDRTASGALQVESLGISVTRRKLNFNDMSLTDYTALINWFLNIANGGANNFYFTDEKDFTGLVKITDSIIDFIETSHELYSGILNMEYVG